MTSDSPGAGPLARARAAGAFLIPLLLLGGTAFFARFVHPFYPIQKWLFWRYAGYWILCALWSAACVSAGHLTLKRLFRRPLPLLEHLSTSFAVGVFEFFLAMNVAGFLKLYNAGLFVGLPLLMLGAGAWPLWRTLSRALRHLRQKRRSAAPPPVWTYAVLAFGLLGIGMVYFLILTPDNVQFDSRWKHLALAEDYVVSGGIRRFPEGSTVETYPHLATFIYTWAFLLPGGLLFDKVELAAHMEFFGFLWTLVAIPATVRRIAPRALGPNALHLSWVARFLFPGVFLYDSSLSVGGDHIAAIFALPAFTLLLRSWEGLSPRFLALLMMMLAGGGLTKYTGAIILLPFPAIALGARTLWLAYGALRGQTAPAMRRAWIIGPLAAIGFGLLFTAPHWAKNWVFYGDPTYPSLHKHLTPRPWTQDAADLFEWGYKDFQFWRPARSVGGVLQTLRAMIDFSFVPNDWPRFHGKMPVFGSLFTLMLPCLLFFRGTRRIWALTAYVHLGILFWYWTHHQDRYLQTIVPQMAAVTAATIGLLFRGGGGWPRLLVRATRITAAGMIGLQIVWGGDVYFIPTHAMIKSPVKAVVDLLGAGYAKRYEQRFQIYPSFQSIAKALPEGARVLLHDNHVHLGIGAQSVSDWGGWQFGISYGRQKSPREVWDLLSGMGVTHVVWDTQVSKGWDSLAGDIVFFDFALRHTKGPTKHGSMTLAAMSPRPSDASFPTQVAYLGCNDTYKSGLYELSDMTVPVFGPKSRTFPRPRVSGLSADELVKAAAYVVLDPKCQSALPTGERKSFTLAAKRRVIRGKRGTLEIYLRSSGEPAAGAPASPAAPAEAPAEASPDDAGAPEEREDPFEDPN